MLPHETKTEMQIRNLERNLHSAPETPRMPGRRPQDLWAGGTQGLQTRRLRVACGVWTCLPRPPGPPGAASAARADSLPPAPPSIAPAESHPGHPSLPVSPRRAAIQASPSPPLASGPPSEAPYPCCSSTGLRVLLRFETLRDSALLSLDTEPSAWYPGGPTHLAPKAWSEVPSSRKPSLVPSFHTPRPL